MSITRPATPATVDRSVETGKRPVVTWRSILLGAALIPFNCYWVAVMEVQWSSVDATCVSLFFHVIFVILALVVLNRWLSKRFPRWAMSPAEILIVYIMLSLASAIMGRDSMENLLPVLGHPFWYADQSNHFAQFHKFIPTWLAPQDPAALKGYYLGSSTIYDWQTIKVWLPVIAAWSVFILSMLFVMLCINVIVRRHWMDNEKLTFPTIYLPLEMARDKSFLHNRMLWLGFAIPFAIQTMNGLNHLFPSVPYIHLKLRDISPMMAGAPWNGIGWTPIAFYPFAIGMAFFLPLDLSFSCWFFYILRKLVAVAGVAMGYRAIGFSWPFCREQSTGAWIGLCLFMVWAGRKQLMEIVRTAFGTPSPPGGRAGEGVSDAHELLSYRTACLGLLAGFGVMYLFCIRAGMSLWLPPVYLGFFFLLAIGITRIRAELGPPAHELNFVNPENMIVSVIGTNALGTQSLTALSYMFWFNRGYRTLPMPYQLEGMKIGRETRMESRRLLAAILIATVIAVFAAFWALLDVFYKQGQGTAHIQSYTTGIGVEAFTRLQDWHDNPRPTDIVGMSWMGGGFAFTVFLMVMKSRFFWWPFHPAGYALANSYALEYWWTTIFIGWFIKLWIVRYGGIRGYRRALPFFLGVILGDYTAASMWSIVGWALGMSVYRTFIL